MVCLGFGGLDVADGLEQAAVVEPVHLFEGCVSTASKLRDGPRRWMTSAVKI